MRHLDALVVAAFALSLFPQALGVAAQAATPPDEPARTANAEVAAHAQPTPPERRVRIILMRDGQPVGGSSEAPAVAPTAEAQIEAAPLEPLAPPTQTPAPPPAPNAQPTAEPTATIPWTEDQLRTPLAAGEGWRIQVGAFRDAARAEARIAELETTAAGPGADPVRLVAPAQDAQGAIYRAQMSGFVDRAAADGACARLTAAGAACFVIAP